MSRDVNVIEEVKNALQVWVARRAVSKPILEQVPALVDRAVRRLKRKDLLPTRVWEFEASQRKEEKRDNKGNLLYNYVRLPKDFRKLDELFVGDNEVPYVWSPHENYLERISKFQTGEHRRVAGKTSDGEHSLKEFYPYRRLFTITDVNFSDIDETQKVLMMYPYPGDEEYVKVSYHVSGSDLNHLGEEHIESVIREVESILGLRSAQDSEQETLEAIDEWKERQGHNSINRTYHRTKGNFFGKWGNRHDRYKRRR